MTETLPRLDDPHACRFCGAPLDARNSHAREADAEACHEARAVDACP